MDKEFNIETIELEFKYLADEIKLSEFIKFAESMKPTKKVEISSWDIYYSGPGMSFDFIRFRNGPTPEMTIKIKTEDKNNNNRFELNIPLSTKITEYLMKKLTGLLGFKENFRIYKHCDIYWYDKVDIVYYIIYNQDMKEIGRRIEVEARQDYPFVSMEEASAEIKSLEQKLFTIGLTSKNRMRKSLWEQFKK